jgi:3-dehydroquinate dehydratase/shikimate dehydrogenase
MICVSIGRTRHKMMLLEIQEAAKQGAQMIEVRLDFLARPPDFKRILATRPCPMVVTVRRQQDGGRWTRSEEERLMLLRQSIVGGFDWVDLETDVIELVPRFRQVKRIVSYHNPREMPDNLEEIHARMCQQDADVVKLAVRGEKPEDNLRVLRLSANSPKPTVAICMGDLGTASRVLAGRFGAPFTYAAFNRERGIAPGILSYEEIKQTYHYDDIKRDSQVFAVVGDPIGHSLSPLIHNAAFHALGLNCIYVPLRVPRGELGEVIEKYREIPISGYSVTIPHKEAAVRLAKEADSYVDWTQAANTLIARPDGSFAAYNTDCPAAIDALLAGMEKLEGGPHLTGRNILLLGAGGAARAIAHTLHREGALVIITNRTADRAQQLAAEIGCRTVDWNARHSVIAEIVINCTSLGMFPNIDESPIHHSFLKPNLVVFDVVYNPETTLLVKEARERSCHVITGVDMFVRQAALQFKLFTGLDAPLDVMRKAVRRALSPVALREEVPA